MIGEGRGAKPPGACDLVVVGLGIHGAVAALEATRRGLRVVALDRSDFGGATSWNSLRVLHGGLRYLQSGDLARYRGSVRSRSWFVRELPELVDAVGCLMPLYGEGVRRASLLGPALALDRALRRLWSSKSDRDLILGKVITIDRNDRVVLRCDLADGRTAVRLVRHDDRERSIVKVDSRDVNIDVVALDVAVPDSRLDRAPVRTGEDRQQEKCRKEATERDSTTHRFRPGSVEVLPSVRDAYRRG